MEVHAAYIPQRNVGEAQQYTKRAGLKEDYRKIYDAVYENVGLLEEDYPAGALIFDFSKKDISFRASSGDTIYIPLGSMQDDHPELEWIAPENLEAVPDPATGKLMGIRPRNTVTNARIEPYQDKSVFDMK